MLRPPVSWSPANDHERLGRSAVLERERQPYRLVERPQVADQRRDVVVVAGYVGVLGFDQQYEPVGARVGEHAYGGRSHLRQRWLLGGVAVQFGVQVSVGEQAEQATAPGGTQL